MNKIIQSALIILVYLSFINPAVLLSAHFEAKFFSSETGYAVVPEMLYITDAFNPKNAITLNRNSDNSFSGDLNNGSYFITAFKSGYLPSQTQLTAADSEIKYEIFLDPLTTNQLISTQRIKSMLKPDKSLLLGYVVDDITGEPLGGVSLENGTDIFGVTDINGYFEINVPASCDVRTMVDLSFEKHPYVSSLYTGFEITPNTDFIFTVRMKRTKNTFNNSYGDKCYECRSQAPFTDMPVSGFVVPLNIRVGRNCTGTNCTTVQVYSLQTYCKYVLPAEIYSCWGNLAGGMNSLQACAVAVRSYGTYRVYNPINSNYDICDNTYCQFMGSVQSTNTNTAVDNTLNYLITNSSGVVSSEYSAENNNKGCGNGYSGTGSSWPCIYDPVCTGGSPNGHGRGLCQWGTVRWATGRLVSTSSPCSQGTAHSYGTKTWQQILTHYYGISPVSWNVTMGLSSVINTSSASPSSSNPCAQIMINNNITSNGNVSLMIGTSIAPAGTENWISDPANDVKRTLSQGTGNYTRVFNIPCNTVSGTYDLYTALWYDKNNSNTIDGGDFVVSSKITAGAITISPIGINPVNTIIPEKFALYSNYPNPFNPVTKIRFDIAKASFTKVIIYDAKGTKIHETVNEHLNPGSYEIDWDGSRYASGVYFYSLTANDFSETKKMVLVK